MAFCKKCGASIDDNSKFCPSCGASQETQTGVIEDIAMPKGSSGVLNVGMLVWSIINIVCLCVPLGIAGLILTLIAKDAHTAEDEAKKIKSAKVCNLIGSIAAILVIILYVAFFALGILAGLESY